MAHRAIDVVQPDPSLPPLLRGALRDAGGNVLDVPVVVAVIAEPRHHLDHGADRYDLIQLVALEGSAAGSGGVGGLGEDHLMTVQGVGAALRRLTDDGILFVCRGMQEPPRDNLKVFATFIEALRRAGVEDPQRHLVIVRDFLGVCTLLKATPWSTAQIQAVRALCSRRQLTPVWFEGIQPQELNQPDALPPPPQGQGDWYHHAAMRLFHPDTARRFIDDYPFDIRPPTDDRPFFFDFCRLRLDPGAARELRRTVADARRAGLSRSCWSRSVASPSSAPR